MTQVVAPGFLRYAGLYLAPRSAASSDSYALQRIWAEALHEWRLPATNQSHGATVAASLVRTAHDQVQGLLVVLQARTNAILGSLVASLSRIVSLERASSASTPIRVAALEDN